MDDALEQLTEQLRELPGIGPRQARRLAHWLLRKDRSWIDRFTRVLMDAHKTVVECASCKRLFVRDDGSTMCSICSNDKRDHELLLVVERDADLENIERTGTYNGLYFVLGGTAGPLDKHPEKRIRINALKTRMADATHAVREIIFAVSATAEGEDTATYVREVLEPLITKHNTKVTMLGRGLSTGTELEYVDADTMKSALSHRV